VPVRVENDLAEADFGDWSGLTWVDIAQRWPNENRAFHADPAQHGYPSGENFAQVLQRVLPVFQRLALRHAGEIFAVVGHGTVNRVLLAHWIGIPIRYARQLPQDNASLSLVENVAGHARVRTINATTPPRSVCIYWQQLTCHARF
jgi:broad specificity phosphatase PhoE